MVISLFFHRKFQIYHTLSPFQSCIVVFDLDLHSCQVLQEKSRSEIYIRSVPSFISVSRKAELILFGDR